MSPKRRIECPKCGKMISKQVLDASYYCRDCKEVFYPEEKEKK
jgi:ribosomal protein L37AE/L43A